MRLNKVICEYCGGTYSNKDAIGFSGFLTLAAGLDRPDEHKQFCSLECLGRWCADLLVADREFGAVEVPGWSGFIHSDMANAQLVEWWHSHGPEPADSEPADSEPDMTWKCRAAGPEAGQMCDLAVGHDGPHVKAPPYGATWARVPENETEARYDARGNLHGNPNVRLILHPDDPNAIREWLAGERP